MIKKSRPISHLKLSVATVPLLRGVCVGVGEKVVAVHVVSHSHLWPPSFLQSYFITSRGNLKLFYLKEEEEQTPTRNNSFNIRIFQRSDIIVLNCIFVVLKNKYMFAYLF